MKNESEPAKVRRKQDGTWQKGQSGNPAGMPKGCRRKTTAAMEAILAENSEALMRKAIELALADRGGPTLRALLPLLVAPLRERSTPIQCDLPPLKTADDICAGLEAVAKSIRAGELDVDAIKALTGFLDAVRASTVTAEQAQELSELRMRVEEAYGK